MPAAIQRGVLRGIGPHPFLPDWAARDDVWSGLDVVTDESRAGGIHLSRLRFNVKDFGAAVDGITDDTRAWLLAMATAATVNGEVLCPAGTSVCNLADSPAQSTGWLRIRGAGKYATTLLGSKGVDHVLGLFMPGEVTDMTVDGGGVTINALVLETSGTIAISEMAARRVRCRNVSAASGSWNLVVWDTAQIFQIDHVYLDDVTVEGPSATNVDAFSVSYINVCHVRDIEFRGLHRSPNFYCCNDLIINGLFSDGCPSAATFVIDYLVSRAVVNNVIVDATNANGTPIIIGAPYLQATNWNVTLPVNPTGGQIQGSSALVAGATWEFANCKLNSVSWNVGMRLVSFMNTDLFAQPNGYCVGDLSAASTTTTTVRLIGCTLDASPFNFNIFGATNAVTWSKLTIIGCEFLRLGSIVISNKISVSTSSDSTNQGAFGTGFPPTSLAASQSWMLDSAKQALFSRAVVCQSGAVIQLNDGSALIGAL